jgi:hypothetical protein
MERDSILLRPLTLAQHAANRRVISKKFGRECLLYIVYAEISNLPTLTTEVKTIGKRNKAQGEKINVPAAHREPKYR